MAATIVKGLVLPLMAIVQAEKRQEIYFTGNLQVAIVGWSK
jgi:hypothetical protein